MTEPTIEGDVEVPLRLRPVVARSGGPGGRSVNLIALGLVGFVVIGLLLGTAYDNGQPARPAAVADASATPRTSPTPTRTRRPTPTPVPLATPLPTVEINSADVPDERRLVYGNGPQILDLATGTMRSFGRSYEDVVWADGDGFVCVCVVRELGVNTSTAVSLQFGRFDQAGGRQMERDIVVLDEIVPVPEMTDGFNVAAARDAAGETLFVVDVVRRPPVWLVELHVVDAATGDLLDSAVIDSFPVDLEEPGPSASPRPGTVPDGVYVWANMIAVAPDGGSAYLLVSRSNARSDTWTNNNIEYLVPIRDRQLGDPTPVPADASLGDERWCIGRPTFVDSDSTVQVCGPALQSGAGQSWSVRRLSATAEAIGDWPIGAAQSDGSAVSSLVDRDRRAVYLWDGFRHLVSRVDIDTGRASEGVVDESLLTGDRQPPGRTWVGLDPGLVPSADGTRLYALGLETGTANAARSTGIWVFDADTLELLDHWQPRALLTSLAVSADGRFVFAAGAAGYDADGNENSRWRASVTVYRVTTGEVALLYGNIGEGQWIGFQTPF